MRQYRTPLPALQNHRDRARISCWSVSISAASLGGEQPPVDRAIFVREVVSSIHNIGKRIGSEVWACRAVLRSRVNRSCGRDRIVDENVNIEYFS
ncbi:hypothetical protein NPIL_226941 [Nephila pilipes]|uniref:Uncharacterized protein n=1 Tax=Nephila pilipes TaxID=299642 RepID=A0A8X6Q9S7_NEPPI|nr:hypothetical protein NPIL_226941 [Nephila pilipes]